MPTVSWLDLKVAAEKLELVLEDGQDMITEADRFMTEVEKTPKEEETNLDPMVTSIYNQLVGDPDRGIAPAKIVNHPSQTPEEIEALLREDAPATAPEPAPAEAGEESQKKSGKKKAEKPKKEKKPKEKKEKPPKEPKAPGYRDTVRDMMLRGDAEGVIVQAITEMYVKVGKDTKYGADRAKKIIGDIRRELKKEGKLLPQYEAAPPEKEKAEPAATES